MTTSDHKQHRGHHHKNALVLTGGGARAAYQVGVLCGIQEVMGFHQSPFEIITGISAGAINGTWLAAYAKDFQKSTDSLMRLWEDLTVNDIFKTSTMSFVSQGAHWIKDLGFGQWFGKSKITHMLDTSPLHDLLREVLSFEEIQDNIRLGLVHALAVTATNYRSGNTITFFDGREDLKPWSKGSRVGVREQIEVEHILASAAIPIFFAPVRLKTGFYGDGGIRTTAPLSPAVHLGAGRILAIGIDHREAVVALSSKEKAGNISIGDIFGTLLNAMFFGSLEDDVERLQRINRTLSIVTPEKMAEDKDQLRPIRILSFHPSQDLGTLATDQFFNFSLPFRHMLKGLGVTDEKGWDLLSYLAFDGSYAKVLIEIGRKDAHNRKEEIKDFFKT